MAQLDFYATAEDMVDVIDLMFSLAEMRLYEAYSAVDKPIREFKNGREILSSGHLDDNHGAVFVRGWWCSVTSQPFVREFRLNPGLGTSRFELCGVAAFQLLMGRFQSDSSKALQRSTFTHWNEAGARQRSSYSDADVDAVDWKEFHRLSSIVHRRVRGPMSRASLHRVPILKGAFGLLESGSQFWGYPGIFDRTSEQVTRDAGAKTSL